MMAMTMAAMGMRMLAAQAALLEIVRLPTTTVHVEAQGQQPAM
jgi:hypothetical protein